MNNYENLPDNTLDVLRMVADLLEGKGPTEPTAFGLYAAADGSGLWLNEADDCDPWIRVDGRETDDVDAQHWDWEHIIASHPASCFPFKRIDVRVITKQVEAKVKDGE